MLDGHQGILDGYHYRFDPLPHISIVLEARNAADLEAGLAHTPADIVLMELRAPASAQNPAAYPIQHLLPRLLTRYPGLVVVIFSSVADPRHIHSAVEAGARGYIIKDDAEIYPALAQVLTAVHQGENYYSPTAQAALSQAAPRPGARGLLTKRQLQALSLCAAYPSYSQARIAVEMNVRPSTVRNLLSQAYQRLEVNSRPEAVQRAQKLGLLP
jgi:DNA-binding NarL/FixJ family response regulator